MAAAAGDLTAARDRLPGRPATSASRLAAADPANTEWQRDLSVSHNKLGDVAVAAGDLTAARDRLPGRPATSRERLAAADPANTGWQRDLRIARQRIDHLPPIQQ